MNCCCKTNRLQDISKNRKPNMTSSTGSKKCEGAYPPKFKKHILDGSCFMNYFRKINRLQDISKKGKPDMTSSTES